MRKLLVALTGVWIAVSITGAILAANRDYPYDLSFLDRAGEVDRIVEDWLYGWGTGLSGPFAMIAVAAIGAVLSITPGGSSRVGCFLLVLVGAASIVRVVTEQLTYDRFGGDSTHGGETGLIIADLVLSGLLVLLGFTGLLTAPTKRFT